MPYDALDYALRALSSALAIYILAHAWRHARRPWR